MSGPIHMVFLFKAIKAMTNNNLPSIYYPIFLQRSGILYRDIGTQF